MKKQFELRGEIHRIFLGELPGALLNATTEELEGNSEAEVDRRRSWYGLILFGGAVFGGSSNFLICPSVEHLDFHLLLHPSSSQKLIFTVSTLAALFVDFLDFITHHRSLAHKSLRCGTFISGRVSCCFFSLRLQPS